MSLTIGEFAQRCGLSRSALRFYDQTGLLLPQSVDAETGYRFYAPAQVDTALLIRRLRAAEMPVAELRRYLGGDAATRAELLDAHARAFRERADAVANTLAGLRADLASGNGTNARFCELPGAALTAALDQVRFAMADPADRPELARIWVETREQSLRLVATDSYRMAVRDLVPASLGSEPVRAAIAGERLDDLRHSLAGAQTVTLSQDREVLSATAGPTSRAVGGPAPDFPDYERILSALPAGARVVVTRRALERALDEIPISEAPVALHFAAPTGLTVQRPEPAGASAIPVGGDWTGPEFVVHLDRGFLSDAVAATVGPDVTIEAIEPFQPVTFRSADTGTFSVLTMPVRP